jgi:lipooligosaccharide transport system permease protein
MPLPVPDPRNVRLLLVRFWYEYRELWKTQIFRDLLDRLIFLIAFGLGMGNLLASSHGGNYLAFIVPGMAASTGLLVMSLAMTFGAYERMMTTRLWQAWLASPLRLPDIVLGELLYATLRSVPSTLILLAVAWFLGALPSPLGALASLPFLILANLALGSIALCFTAHIRRTLHFAYVQTLWTGPLFLFSGVFFDLHHAPPTYQLISQLSPLTHVIAVARPLMLGQPLDPASVAADTAVLVLLFMGGYTYAAWRFQKRLLD